MYGKHVITSRPESAGHRGFTLVELSIVIVIIGLIVSGITGGASLMHAAETKAVIADIQKYRVAVNAFAMQYDAVPGDMKIATSYWPTAVGNGNGNGNLGEGSETTWAWQHLSLAQLMPGLYTGIHTNPPIAGSSVPRSAFDTNVIFRSECDGPIWEFSACSINYFYFAPADKFSGAAFSPQTVADIDAKMDDGVALLGRLRGSGVACVVSGSYVLSTTTNVCALIYVLY